MEDQLWRLSWALPLVIVIGVGALYWLKRMGVGMPGSGAQAGEPRVLSRTTLTEHTQVLVVEVQHQRYVVFESTAQVSVQASSTEMYPLASRMFGRRPS